MSNSRPSDEDVNNVKEAVIEFFKDNVVAGSKNVKLMRRNSDKYEIGQVADDKKTQYLEIKNDDLDKNVLYLFTDLNGSKELIVLNNEFKDEDSTEWKQVELTLHAIIDSYGTKKNVSFVSYITAITNCIFNGFHDRFEERLMTLQENITPIKIRDHKVFDRLEYYHIFKALEADEIANLRKLINGRLDPTKINVLKKPSDNVATVSDGVSSKVLMLDPAGNILIDGGVDGASKAIYEITVVDDKTLKGNMLKYNKTLQERFGKKPAEDKFDSRVLDELHKWYCDDDEAEPVVQIEKYTENVYVAHCFGPDFRKCKDDNDKRLRCLNILKKLYMKLYDEILDKYVQVDESDGTSTIFFDEIRVLPVSSGIYGGSGSKSDIYKTFFDFIKSVSLNSKEIQEKLRVYLRDTDAHTQYDELFKNEGKTETEGESKGGAGSKIYKKATKKNIYMKVHCSRKQKDLLTGRKEKRQKIVDLLPFSYGTD